MGRGEHLLVQIAEEDRQRGILARSRRQARRNLRRRVAAAVIVFVIAVATVALVISVRRYRP